MKEERYEEMEFGRLHLLSGVKSPILALRCVIVIFSRYSMYRNMNHV